MRGLLCLVLLALFPLAEGQAAPVPGAAVFVKVVSAADDAPSDAYEQRLAGGPARVLVSHAALPKSFRGRIERVFPSPDGAVLLLVESDGTILKNTHTGATRVVSALNGLPPPPGEVEAEGFIGGYWLWWRKTGAVKRIAFGSPNRWGVPFGAVELVGWSPRGRLFLADVLKLYTESLCVVNGVTGKTRSLLTIRTGDHVLRARWTNDGAAVLVWGRIRRTNRMELVSLTGKTQRLLTRARLPDIWAAAVSPDGRRVAAVDTRGLSLLSRNGGARRKRDLPLHPTWPAQSDWGCGANDADAVFSSDGSALAIFAAPSGVTSGEGEGAPRWESLWAIRTETAAPRQLAMVDTPTHRWLTHKLLGWVPGQPALFVANESYWNGVATKRQKLWLQPIDPARPARLLVDTGPGGIDIAWWGELSASGRRARGK